MKIQSSKEFIDKLDSYKNSRLVEKFQFWCYEVLRQGKPSQLKILIIVIVMVYVLCI